MEVLIDLSSVCTGLTLIQRNAIKESGVFSCKMSDVIASPPAKLNLPVQNIFWFPEVKIGDNKDKLDSFLTIQSQIKVNPGFSFDLGPRVLMLDYLK